MNLYDRDGNVLTSEEAYIKYPRLGGKCGGVYYKTEDLQERIMQNIINKIKKDEQC